MCMCYIIAILYNIIYVYVLIQYNICVVLYNSPSSSRILIGFRL